MPSHLHRLSTWFVLVVALFAAMPPAAGVAVCFGHDGHVELGEAGEPCPCDHEPGAGESEAPEPDVDEHGPCHDVVVDPLEASLDVDAGRFMLDCSAEAATPFVVVPWPVFLRDAGRRLDVVAASVPRGAALIRSVVLLL